MFQATDNEILWVMRGAVFAVGGAACGMAISVDSIYILFYLCSDLMYALMFPQLTCVLHLSWANTYGSVTGFALGLFFRMAGGESMVDFRPLIKYPWYDEVTKTQNFPFKTLAMLMSFIGIMGASLVTNVLFTRQILPAKADIFKCFSKKEEEVELKQDMNSKE